MDKDMFPGGKRLLTSIKILDIIGLANLAKMAE
jgi:hypothetical protein